jgi:hypothetical protein
MTCLFERDTWRGKEGPFTPGQVVANEIDNADFDGGQIERVANQLNKLVDIVGTLADLLSPKDQLNLVNTISYGYSRVENTK